MDEVEEQPVQTRPPGRDDVHGNDVGLARGQISRERAPKSFPNDAPVRVEPASGELDVRPAPRPQLTAEILHAHRDRPLLGREHLLDGVDELEPRPVIGLPR